MKPILVLGATGHYGRHIVRGLVKRQAPVRALSRSAAHAREVLGDAPEILEGDLTSPDVVARALEGAGGLVVSVSAMNPQQIRRMKAIEQDAVIAALEQAERGGVKRVVFVSVYDIRPDVVQKLRLEEAGIKQAVETHLVRSGLNWTVLGAPPSMELFFATLRGNRLIAPGGGPPAGVPSISPVDLGEIAAQAVLRSDLGGLRLRVPGPDALTFPDVARRLSAVYGREIRVRRIPLLLPRMAWWITRPLARISDRMYYVHMMIAFVKLLNLFPADLAAQVPADHQRLRERFQFTATTLEMEARRRMDEERATPAGALSLKGK
jgi:uncharacterized protein YbjT (DUF2867 family)